MRLAAIIAMALVLGSAAAGCARPPARRPETVSTQTVNGLEYRFEPAVLELQAGQPVRLVFRNTGATAHDLQVLEMPAEVRGKDQRHAEHGKTGANGAVHAGTDASGQEASIEFVPVRSGEYQMICTLPGHAEAGMRGVVRVR